MRRSALFAAFSLLLSTGLSQNYSEPFTLDANPPSGWSVTGGTWNVTGDTYNQTSYTPPVAYSTYGSVLWNSNYTLSAKVRAASGGSGNRAGLIFNWVNSTNYAYVQLSTDSSKTLVVGRVTSSTFPAPVITGVWSGATPDANGFITVEVIRSGADTTIRLNGVSQGTSFTNFTFNDALSTGRVGVMANYNGAAKFDDVNVTTSASTPLFTPGRTETEGSTTYTPTRWVDSNAPDDVAAGTQADPWKYAPGMPGANPAHVAAPGDVIALKRGSVWRLSGTWEISSSGSSTGSPVIYTAYGSGDLPKVTLLEDLQAGSVWTSHSGPTANVFKRTLPAGMVIERLYVDGIGVGEATASVVNPSPAINWVGQTSTVTCIREPSPNPTPGTINDGKTWTGGGNWILDNTTPSTHNTGIMKSWKQIGTTLYYYSPSGDPDELSVTIEGLKADTDATQLQFAVNCKDRSHVYLDRIAFEGGSVAVVNLEATGTNAPTNVRVTNCDVRYAQQKGIRVWSTTTNSSGFSNGQIRWNRVESGDGPDTRVVLNDARYGSGLDEDGSDPADLQSFPGEGRLGSNDGISLWNGVKFWTVAQNDVSNFWHTLIKVARNTTNDSVADTTGNVLERNNAHAENINYSHGIEITCGQSEARSYKTHGNTIRYNKIYDTWVASAFHGRNNKFFANLIMGVYGSPRYCLASNSWRADAIQVKGFDDAGGQVIQGGVIAYNTVVNAGGPGIALVADPGAVQNELVIANNLVAYCGFRRYNTSSPYTPRYIAFRDQHSGSSVVDVDNNLFYGYNIPQAVAVANVYEYNGQSNWTDVLGMQSLESGSWENGWVGNLSSNPGFVSYPNDYFVSGTANDYKLQSGSPANGTAGLPKAKNITAHLPESGSWHDIGCWQVP